MAVDAAASIVLETSDESLLECAGVLLRDHLSPGDRQRLHAILVYASWSASFRPVLSSFVLERLALPLDAPEPPAIREQPAVGTLPPDADSA